MMLVENCVWNGFVECFFYFFSLVCLCVFAHTFSRLVLIPKARSGVSWAAANASSAFLAHNKFRAWAAGDPWHPHCFDDQAPAPNGNGNGGTANGNAGGGGGVGGKALVVGGAAKRRPCLREGHAPYFRDLRWGAIF